MSTQEQLLSAHKAVSKMAATLSVVIFVLSVYVAQRALAVVGMSPLLFDQLSSSTYQISFFELGFSYRTITTLAPGIVGALCVLSVLLERKRRRIEAAFNVTNRARPAGIGELDPFHLTPQLFRSRVARSVGTLFAVFPVYSVGIHVFVIVLWVATLGWNSIRLDISADLQRLGYDSLFDLVPGAVFSASTTVFAAVGFVGAFVYMKTMRQKLRIARAKANGPADR
jgi:hypothetical protein